MKSPIIKTFVMFLVALAASAVAAAFYPWPERVVESEIVGKPLFEAYDTNAVRSIEIMRFDEETDSLEQVLLRRSAERWLMPSFKKFIATNTLQIAATANSLSDCIVIEEKTDQQQEYAEYGVVDPSEYQNTTNRSSMGTKLILKNRNDKELGSLIVGKRLKDDPKQLKHFVRIPGQPSVYIVELDPMALTTDFRGWINPNLFQLGSIPINKIEIENYRIPEMTAETKRQLNYRAALNVGQDSLQVLSLETGSREGGWDKVESSPQINQQLQVLTTQLDNLEFVDVRKKTAELSALFRSPKAEANKALLESLKPLGFVFSGFGNNVYEIDSSGGEVSVETMDGVVLTLNIGGIANQAGKDGLQLNYYALITAGVDESVLPKPEKQKATDNEEENQNNEKAYKRDLQMLQDVVKLSRSRASEINQKHADWVYIVSEKVIENIRPDVDLSSAKKVVEKPVIGVAPKTEPTEKPVEGAGDPAPAKSDDAGKEEAKK
jgi:hypothetical protein